MFKQLALFCVLASIAYSVDLPTQEQYSAELKTAGMSQGSIDGLAALSQKFVSTYPLVQANKEQADKFIADYTVEAQNYVAAMNPTDKKIYEDSLKKYGVV